MTLSENIRLLGNKYQLVTVNFEKMFRDNALLKTNMESFKCDIEISKKEFQTIISLKTQFGNLFFESDSFLLFWICKCLSYNKKSLLSYLNNYISLVCNTKRGGLNTYKLNGWDVHILYVYQLINYNISNIIIPKAYHWYFDVIPFFKFINSLYLNLSKEAKFILKMGGFLHDIGVTIQVKDHETLGANITEEFYDELNIEEHQITKLGIDLEYHEIIVAIKEIIGNHQIINQISAEVSDKYIYDKIEKIRNSFSFSTRLCRILQDDFVELMTILAIADMMAVDDSLLTESKINEIKESFDFLKKIINTGVYTRNHKTYAIKRLISLLADDLKSSSKDIIYNYLRTCQDAGASLTEFLYNVKFLSYGMAAIKPLHNTEKTLKLIEFCNLIYLKSNITLSDLVFKFNPDINLNKLDNILNYSINDILSNKMIKFCINKEENIIEISTDEE